MPEDFKVKMSENPAIKEAIEKESIFHTVGLTAFPAVEGREPFLSILVPIDIGKPGPVKGTISMSEADNTFSPRNMNYLVGKDIVFVITGVDEENDVLLCSRKIAQDKNKVALLAEMAQEGTFEGVITGIKDFGAFVEVRGVSGMLRNSDYATDHSRIASRYAVGDRINVKCKSIVKDSGRIYWEAATKYHRTTPVVCNIEEGAVTVGKVIDVRTFEQGQGVFVRPVDGSEVDVLCSMPRNIPELDRDVMVVIRVLRIQPGKTDLDLPLVRGMILGLAQT